MPKTRRLCFSHVKQRSAYMNTKVFSSFFPYLSHIFALKKKCLMSSPLTPFHATQQHSRMSSSGLYTATRPSCTSNFSTNDTSPTSTSFTSGPYTPLAPLDHSLLSPLDISSLMVNTLSPSIRPTNENGAYMQLVREHKMIKNEFRKEKQAHEVLK